MQKAHQQVLMHNWGTWSRVLAMADSVRPILKLGFTSHTQLPATLGNPLAIQPVALLDLLSTGCLIRHNGLMHQFSIKTKASAGFSDRRKGSNTRYMDQMHTATLWGAFFPSASSSHLCWTSSCAPASCCRSSSPRCRQQPAPCSTPSSRGGRTSARRHCRSSASSFS